MPTYPAVVVDSVFVGNSAGYQGGALFVTNRALSLSGCTISGNAVTLRSGRGAGVYLYDATVSAAYTIICGNTVQYGSQVDGGGASAWVDGGGNCVSASCVWCYRDYDGDGVANEADNCPAIANPGQADCDQDGLGDAGELGDAEADFIAAMRLDTTKDTPEVSLVDLLLKRALQRGHLTTRALSALGSISEQCVGKTAATALRLSIVGRRMGFGEDPVRCAAQVFFYCCHSVGDLRFERFRRLGFLKGADLEQCVEELEQIARCSSAGALARFCRDIVVMFHEPPSGDPLRSLTQLEMAAADCPGVRWYVGCLLSSTDARIQGWFPDRHACAVRVLRLMVQTRHIPAARALLDFLREESACADPSEVIELNEIIASRGGAADAAALAWRFAKGDGVPKDEAKATEWFGKAAAAGDANSQCNYGFRLGQGIGIAVDLVGAVDWYRKSAEGGSAVAIYNMGCAYAAGLGVPKDEAEAFNWFLRAANAGYANAMHVIARRLYTGQGIQCDHEQAVEWAERLRATGDARGSVLLGKAYISGQGVPADLEKAKALLEEGVQRGSADAAA